MAYAFGIWINFVTGHVLNICGMCETSIEHALEMRQVCIRRELRYPVTLLSTCIEHVLDLLEQTLHPCIGQAARMSYTCCSSAVGAHLTWYTCVGFAAHFGYAFCYGLHFGMHV